MNPLQIAYDTLRDIATNPVMADCPLPGNVAREALVKIEALSPGICTTVRRGNVTIKWNGDGTTISGPMPLHFEARLYALHFAHTEAGYNWMIGEYPAHWHASYPVPPQELEFLGPVRE